MGGAMGRFEADDDGITLDLKGYQFRGMLHPGPTAMVLTLSAHDNVAKVEALTDEFVTIEKTQNVMERMNAVVSGELDDGYLNTAEVNVNEKKDSKTEKEESENNIDEQK